MAAPVAVGRGHRAAVAGAGDHRPVLLYGFGLDISELFEAQQRFRSAFEHAASGMSLVSVDGRFLQPNPALCALLGYPREELIEKSFRFTCNYVGAVYKGA